MKIKRHSLRKGLCLVLMGVALYHCKDDKPKSSASQVSISFKKEGQLTILKSETDSILAQLDIEIADDDYETQTGLMYRTELKANHGMLFIFPDEALRSFYMKNTKIPLDIIYIDQNLSVVSIQKNAQPFDESSLPSEGPAKYVLEVNAGLSDTWQLEKGDRISFERQ